MQRLTAGIISLIIVGATFIYLWLTNPLYAFIGGVVFLVFVIVGYALVKTLSQRSTSPVEPAQHVLPRRTGEFKRIEDVERPEGSWEDLDTPAPPKLEPLDETLDFSDVDEKKKESAIPPAQPPAPAPAPEPKPALAPDQAQSFGAISTEQTEVSSNDEVETEAPSEPAGVYEDEDDTEEEIIEEANEPAEASQEEDDEAWVEQITDDVTNSRLLAGVKDFDDFAENVQQQMDAGTLGDSPEDLEEFFQSAFDKAKQREDVEDYIDDEAVDEVVDELIKGEAIDWLHEEAEAERERQFIPEHMVEDLNFEESVDDFDLGIEWEEAESEEDTDIAEANFDLMSMVNALDEAKRQAFFAKMSEIPIGEQSEQQLIALYKDLVKDNDDVPNNKVSDTQFTAYYPRQASAGTEYGFYVYAHLPDSLVASDIQQFQSELGGRVPKPKVSAQTATIEEGATISVIIQCDKLKFNQLGSMQVWREPYVRFDFNFIAHKALVDEIVEGRIAILLGMVEIASIDFQIGITPVNPIASITSQPVNPLNALGYDPSTSTGIYQKIFVSYSHDDTAIAEQYRKVQTMLGNTVFMDTHSIRVGEAWETALKKFIDEADVFQLFWSKNSAISEHVRFEWNYALNQRCPDTRCANFIRPTYWEKPLPEIPLELGHLHFAFVEIL